MLITLLINSLKTGLINPEIFKQTLLVGKQLLGFLSQEHYRPKFSLANESASAAKNTMHYLTYPEILLF